MVHVEIDGNGQILLVTDKDNIKLSPEQAYGLGVKLKNAYENHVTELRKKLKELEKLNNNQR